MEDPGILHVTATIGNTGHLRVILVLTVPDDFIVTLLPGARASPMAILCFFPPGWVC